MQNRIQAAKIQTQVDAWEVKFSLALPATANANTFHNSGPEGFCRRRLRAVHRRGRVRLRRGGGPAVMHIKRGGSSGIYAIIVVIYTIYDLGFCSLRLSVQFYLLDRHLNDCKHHVNAWMHACIHSCSLRVLACTKNTKKPYGF